jgi:hypothetical protein
MLMLLCSLFVLFAALDRLRLLRQIESLKGERSSLLGRQFDAGSFDTNGYSVNYSFAPTDVSGQVGTLTVRVSGSMLFIGTAMNRLDASIRPYITVS